MYLIDWSSVTIPKLHGGLGIVDLGLKNQGLLTKWAWRYGNEPTSLWRRVIDAKGGGLPQSMMLSPPNRGKCSFIWQNISTISSSGTSSPHLSGFLCLLGNGQRILFWQDKWANNLALKDLFPRIFALAIDKHGFVVDFGRWDGDSWVWNVRLRRGVFGWELSQWNAFLSTINLFFPCREDEDALIWSHSTGGEFSVKSYCKVVRNLPQSGGLVWKRIWSGCVPPKVEVFSWLLIKKRVAVKTELLRRGLIEESAAVCVVCNKELESVEHLFFKCHDVWRIWTSFMNQWGVDGPLPCEPAAFLLCWDGLFTGSGFDTWHSLFFAVVWTIWLSRNQMIFNGKLWDFLQVFNTVKLRLAHWVKAKKPDLGVSVDTLFRCPEMLFSPPLAPSAKRNGSWSCPPIGSLKFNVDGSAAGKPGPAGIGGVLRDDQGRIKAKFSKPIGIADSNYAEFLAIREAFVIFAASEWVNSHSLMVESDSSNAILWLNNPGKAPWRLKTFSNHIRQLQKNLLSWHGCHIPREWNEIADGLAKEGVYRTDDLILFC